jgi:hypothetical protein
MAIRMVHGRRSVLAASVLAVAVLAGGSSASAALPDDAEEVVAVPAEDVTVEVVTVNGSGCPAGTAFVRPLADNTGFTVRFSNYVAAVGGSAEPIDFRKNCQLSLLVHAPQGFTYAVARADYTGTARLANGASALQRANYYFQGSPVDNVSDHEFTGPLYSRWTASDTAEAASLVYAPCGEDKILNVNTELRVDNGASSASSSIRMTAASGGVNTIYHFAWKKC